MDKMFCYQCQETAKGTGCTTIGVCGKDAETSGLQDLLLHTEKGVAAYSAVFRKNGKAKELLEGKVNRYLINSLFITITNANFDDAAILDEIKAGLKLREELKVLVTNEEKKEAEKYGAEKNVSCYGSHDGAIGIRVVNPVSNQVKYTIDPYQTTWTTTTLNAQGAFTITGLSATQNGVVTVQDATQNSCVVSLAGGYKIGEPSIITPTVVVFLLARPLATAFGR